MTPEVHQALGAWLPVVSHLFKEPFMANIGEILGRDKDVLQPALPNIFRALTLCPPDKVKVVIIGQDPYPGGEADGLCFSSGTGTRPYSLGIIFNELSNDGFGYRAKNSLEDWAEQGVLLLNTHLTTVKGSVNAHANIGWERFTGTILRAMIVNKIKVVFILWGKSAQDTLRNSMILTNEYDYPQLILKVHHPAAQRYGYNFVGCGHFGKANEYLIQNGKGPIKWV